jgi:ABC-type transporter Mla subunit MlaD
MNGQTSHFKLGLFVLASIAIIFGGLFMLGTGVFSRRATLTLETYVKGSVEGIQRGSEVHYRGIPVGTVSEVTLTGDVYESALPFPRRRPYVLVRFTVATKPFGNISSGAARRLFEDWVSEGLHVMRQPLGLSGDSYLEMDFVSKAPAESSLTFDWAPQFPYVPEAPGFSGDLSTMMREIQNAVREIAQVNFGRLAANFEKTLRTAEQATEKLRSLVSDPRLPAILADASRTAAGLDSIVASSRSDVIAAAGNLRTLSERLDSSTTNLPAVMSDLGAALDRIASVLSYERGDIAGAIRNLDRVAENLRILLEKADENPGLLFAAPPPHVKPAEEGEK